jgi:hypothetical protein
MTEFWTTYNALVTTLGDTFGTKYTSLCTHQTLCVAASDATKLEITSAWQREIQPVRHLIMARNAALFDSTQPLPPCLATLCLSRLWVDPALSPTSKRYLWLYLDRLSVHIDTTSPTSDISPPPEAPPELSGNAGINKIYESLPANILAQVKKVADKYGDKVQSGEQTLEDIRFDEISKDLFEHMSKEDMNDLVTNVGNVLKNLSQPGEEAGMMSLFRTS